MRQSWHQKIIKKLLSWVCGAVLQINMVVLPLFVLLASLAGVCPQRLTEIHVKAGELVALRCPRCKGNNHSDAQLIWTSYTTQEMNLTSNLSSAEQNQMGVLIHGRSLIIFNSSVNHQGNYSCTWRNVGKQSWFRLTVCTSQTEEYEESTTECQRCYEHEACTLNCPDANIPLQNTPNITDKGTTWHKDGILTAGYFPRVRKSDRGVYICTRSYLYHGQVYNKTSTLVLRVEPNKESEKSPVITSPRMDDVFHVDLGLPKVIDCEAVVYSDFDEVFWLSGTSFVEKNNSFPVFYNCTRENHGEEIKVKASLVFKKVSEGDLTKNYTCKLESEGYRSTYVNITLAQRSYPSCLSLALSGTCLVAVMVLTVVIYKKFKINITLFLRDTLGCNHSTPDGKIYDAFVMSYQSDTEAGLSEYDRKWLTSVLEDKYGYNLCLYDRDISPGEAVAQAVLDSLEESRTVVLVPTSPDPFLGSSLLSAIHEALVERQTRLVFIKTESTEVSELSSLPEALQLLVEAGDCVIWKDTRSMQPSSSFWKQLRYRLPAPSCASKTRLLSEKI